jgi:hypothetical protein
MRTGRMTSPQPQATLGRSEEIVGLSVCFLNGIRSGFRQYWHAILLVAL